MNTVYSHRAIELDFSKSTAVCCFFYDTPGRFYVIVYATPESVINILEIVGSDS